MSALTVYKASAGSGKTFTLAAEYIKFLVTNPAEYRHILAVTFTNKATDEMKTRILAQLYGISHSLPDSESYLSKIAEETNVPKEDVRQSASLALSLLIHNYDYFHVETIDTFFQTVLRNLAKELDLSPNLRLELNDIAVEQQAVDTMVEDVDPKSPFFRWLMEYVMDNISDNKSWNVLRSIKDFGKMIFSNGYKLYNEQITKALDTPGFATNYSKKLTQLKESSLARLRQHSMAFDSAIRNAGIRPEDFKGGAARGIAKYFERLAGTDLDDKKFMLGTVAKHLDAPENWAAKSSSLHDQIIALAQEELMPLLSQSEMDRKEAQCVVTSVDATLKNLNNLRILSNINRCVRQMNTDANRFLLSDTQHLLCLMTAESDSPFIFEKIGTRLSHIMIDEFQDTSTIQWRNFRMLLEECMSHTPAEGKGKVENLVVGDVKQSIYRWRAGDWQLLANIEKQFPGRQVETKELKTNYRSASNIVAFNNAFFTEAMQLEMQREETISPQSAEQIKNAYNDVTQNVGSSDRGGEVRVTLLAKEDYEQRTLMEIEQTIDDLMSRGVRQSQMAILLRTKKYIPLIADYFMQNRPDINIVSDEAYRLDRSAVVCAIVAAMKMLYEPENLIIQATLAKHYAKASGKLSQLSLLKALDSEAALLPDELTSGADALRQLPLHDLAERLMQILNLYKEQKENAYVCTFFDILDAYTEDMSADAAGFILQWDDNLHSTKIQTDGVDGIQLISIHKSKGLEFDNVIVPFCNWRLEMTNGNYIWCAPKAAPFSELPLIPIDYSSRLSHSIYEDDYKLEHMQNSIDNLNLLYVAFTRAGKNLYVIGKRKDSNSRSAMIEQLVQNLPDQLADSTLTGADDDKGDLTFEYGSPLVVDKKQKEESQNVFMKTDEILQADVRSYPIPVVFRQSNKSKDFVAQVDGEEKETRHFIKVGNVIHQVLASVTTADDIPMVLDQFESDGILYGDGLDRTTLERKLRDSILCDARVRDWFSGRWQLYNECSILSVDPKTGRMIDRRPDRVMREGGNVVVVDFKTGAMHPQYIEQVRQYVRLLRKMGHSNVSGYLWFINSGKVSEVTLEENNK